jgi:multidrug resistance efflux pump
VEYGITDDAYVNSYVTFVTGQVACILVDDNNRVKKGDVLVELDPEPFHVQAAIKQFHRSIKLVTATRAGTLWLPAHGPNRPSAAF